MPKIVIHRKKRVDDPIEADVVEREWIPSLHFIGSQEILKELAIGEEVEVLVKGKVEGLSADDFGGSDEPPEFSFRIEPTSVEVYPVNEFTRLAEEDS